MAKKARKSDDLTPMGDDLAKLTTEAVEDRADDSLLIDAQTAERSPARDGRSGGSGGMDPTMAGDTMMQLPTDVVEDRIKEKPLFDDHTPERR